jgi:hypothetical protein
MLEKELERKLVSRTKDQGGLALKFISPGNNGVPDRLILLPKGKIAFIEMKRLKGQLKPLQRHWLKKLNDLGFWAECIKSEEEIENLIYNLLKG